MLASVCLLTFMSGPVQAQAPLAPVIKQHLGIFLALPDRREAFEKITLDKGRAEIWFLRSTPTSAARDVAICEGARWLLTGRLEATGGARAVFDARPDLDEMTLIFYALDTSVTPDRNGKYTQDRSARPTARFTIRRETAAQLNVESLKKTLKGARCASLAERVLDAVWTP
jgi:hypothetical protein